MDFKKLGSILAFGGAVVLVAAIAWWFIFYSQVVSELAKAPGGREAGASLRDMARCLYSSDGLCALISGGANLLGKTPYEPMLFWVGLVALVIGVVVRFAAKPATGA